MDQGSKKDSQLNPVSEILQQMSNPKNLIQRTTTVNVKEMQKSTQRKSVQYLLEAMDEDGNGEVEQIEMLNFLADQIANAKAAARVKRILGFTFFVLILSLVSNAICMLVIGEGLKESKTRSDGAFTNLDGDAASIGIIKSYGTLFDLPYQSVSFMKQMKDIVVVVDDNNGGSVVTKYTIESWQHFSVTNMVLYVGQDIHIHLENGTGYVKKNGINYPILVDSSGMETGRRHLTADHQRKLETELRKLNKSFHGVHTFTWSELMDLHLSMRGDEEFRRLSDAGDALADLYMFFGGVVEAEVLSTYSDLTSDCDNTGTCGASIEVAPRPSVPTLSKWDTTDDASGDSLTWWMDMNSMDDVKIHIVTDNGGGTFHHEVFNDGMKYEYTSVDGATVVNAESLISDGKASASFASALGAVKNNCMMDEWDSEGAAENANEAIVLQRYADGSATWMVGGWEVTVTAAGAVTQISGISVNSVAEYDASSEAAGVFSLYESCDPSFDYENEFAEKMEEDRRRHLASMSEEEREAVRKLAFWDNCSFWSAVTAYFSTGAEYGEYCGKGFPGHCKTYGKATINTGWGGVEVCDDAGLDASCSKHDSGTYHKDVWGVATMNYCEVDRAFKVTRNSAGITEGFDDGEGLDYDVVNGANCLFDIMPCIRYENEAYWDYGWKCKWYGCWPTRSRRHRNAYVTKWPGGNYQSGGCNGNCYKSKPS
ncbi:hypothetical protein TrLO_g8988 [Triparma laevis f. longispina]|uniref:EF-hand domain-containing protein n=1 Tax=Triparma laevis f. longispina TaxID=1714387 RepID=A0A9W7AT26_9STRA|nr:hypothetical protein TrLO_g8988 [Triparma laevis f. longispina]